MALLALLSVRLWVRLAGLLLPSNVVVVVVVDGVINAASPRLFWHFKIVAKKQAKSIPGTRIRTSLPTPPPPSPWLASGFIWAYFRVPPSEGRVVSQRSRQIMGQYFRLMLMFSQKFSHCARNPRSLPLSLSVSPWLPSSYERLEAKSVKLLS